MILISVYAMVATIAFAILFNIKGKNIFFAGLGGGIGWLVYSFVMSQDSSITFSLFVATIVISIYSEIMARVLKTPVTTIIICSVIPLVPGNGMFYTMFESIRGNLNKSLSWGLQTIMSAGSIAVAILLVSSTTKLILMRKRLFVK